MLQGKFVFISVESREFNNRVYHNVNLEMEDGQMIRIGAADGVVERMQKYKAYTGFFSVRMFDGRLAVTLADLVADVK